MDFRTDTRVDAAARELSPETDERGVLVIGQTYPTTVEDLWEACTTADRLARWFGPVSGDLELGGRYEVENNASGVVTTCVPPERFSVTWEFAGVSSEVDVTVTEVENGARLELRHGYATDNDFWRTYGPGAAGIGWDLGFLGLAVHLETGSDEPLESTEWMAGDDAVRFITAASTGWAEAAVRAGMDREWAMAAAEQTTAFFTAR